MRNRKLKYANIPSPSIASRLFFLFCLFHLSVASASGKNETEAKRHFEAAKRLYETDDFEGAAIEFESSVRLFPTKNGYFNLANCYKALHRYDDALKAVDALETTFGNQLSDALRDKTDELKTVINSIVGTLTIQVKPTEAHITLNEKPLEKLPQSGRLRLGPGAYRITVTKKGFAPQTKTVTVKSKQTSAIYFTLQPASGQLLITANKPGATVIIDGKEKGKTPLKGPLFLPPQMYTVTLSLKGFAPVTQTVAVTPNGEATLHIQLNAAPQGSSTPSDKTDTLRPSNSANRRPLIVAGWVSTVALAGAAGACWGLAFKHAAAFDDYDNDYKYASNDNIAKDADHNRNTAEDSAIRFRNLGIGFSVGAGIIGITSAILTATKDKNSPSTKTAVTWRGQSLVWEF